MHERILPFLTHLEELRIRLLRISGSVLIAMLIISQRIESVIRLISRPAGHLIFISPAEAFLTYLQVAFWAALFVCSPYALFEIWQFVGVALRPQERRYIAFFLPVSFLLFTVGVWFGFTFVITAGLKFLLSFGQDFMTPMLTVSHYVSFVASMSLSFGVVFQLPVIIALLTKIGLLTPETLSSKRRYAIVLIFIASGVLTPSPDVFSQFCMAIPLLILYEVSIVISRIIQYRKKRADGLASLEGVKT